MHDNTSCADVMVVLEVIETSIVGVIMSVHVRWLQDSLFLSKRILWPHLQLFIGGVLTLHFVLHLKIDGETTKDKCCKCILHA